MLEWSTSVSNVLMWWFDRKANTDEPSLGLMCRCTEWSVAMGMNGAHVYSAVEVLAGGERL